MKSLCTPNTTGGKTWTETSPCCTWDDPCFWVTGFTQYVSPPRKSSECKMQFLLVLRDLERALFLSKNIIIIYMYIPWTGWWMTALRGEWLAGGTWRRTGTPQEGLCPKTSSKSTCRSWTRKPAKAPPLSGSPTTCSVPVMTHLISIDQFIKQTTSQLILINFLLDWHRINKVLLPKWRADWPKGVWRLQLHHIFTLKFLLIVTQFQFK